MNWPVILEIAHNRAQGPRKLLEADWAKRDAFGPRDEAKPLYDPDKAVHWDPAQVMWNLRVLAGWGSSPLEYLL